MKSMNAANSAYNKAKNRFLNVLPCMYTLQIEIIIVSTIGSLLFEGFIRITERFH